MKVIKIGKTTQREKVSFTVRLDRETLKHLDQVAQREKLSRQRLIESVLKQVLKDKDFILRVS